MANHEWCRWYRALAFYETCEKDIAYDSVVDQTARPYRWPCINPEARGQCVAFEGYTQAEIDQEEKTIAAFVNHMTDFAARRSETCIHCGKTVVQLRQVGRSVYASPCGCRLWQGTIPEAWRR